MVPFIRSRLLTYLFQAAHDVPTHTRIQNQRQQSKQVSKVLSQRNIPLTHPHPPISSDCPPLANTCFARIFLPQHAYSNTSYYTQSEMRREIKRKRQSSLCFEDSTLIRWIASDTETSLPNTIITRRKCEMGVYS